MDELDLNSRVLCIANFLSIPKENVEARAVGDTQCDIIIKRNDGTGFRYGYFDNWTFWRENPVRRVLYEHGFSIAESDVGFLSDYQYDMTIEFNGAGSVMRLSDARTQGEIFYNYKKYAGVVEKLERIFRFSHRSDVDAEVKDLTEHLQIYEDALNERVKQEHITDAHNVHTSLFSDFPFYVYCSDGEMVEFNDDVPNCPGCGEKLDYSDMPDFSGK